MTIEGAAIAVMSIILLIMVMHLDNLEKRIIKLEKREYKK